MATPTGHRDSSSASVQSVENFEVYFMIAMKQVLLHTSNSAAVGIYEGSPNIVYCVGLDRQKWQGRMLALVSLLLSG